MTSTFSKGCIDNVNKVLNQEMKEEHNLTLK